MLLSGDIKVNPGPGSNLCDSCGKRAKKRNNMKILDSGLSNKCKRFIVNRDFLIQHYRKTYHSIR